MEEYTKELLDYGLYKSVRRSRKYKGVENKWDYWGEYHNNGHEDIHQFFTLLDKFLQKNVGRPYHKVYGEFCAKWPARICGDIDTRQEIRKMCFADRYPQYHYNIYMVDDRGILKKNPENYHNYHHKEKYITVAYEDETYQYVFNKELFKYPDIVDYLYDMIGYYNTLTIKEEEYIPKDIVSILDSKFNTWKCNDTFIKKHKHFRDCNGWIYKQVIVKSNPTIIKRGTKEFDRYYAESRTAIKCTKRAIKKQRERYHSSLLHNIETKKKEIESKQNIIDRDRLGFDENSFKGEFYHGQKRKKKSAS